MITYTISLDLARDGAYAHPLADITGRVRALAWSLGMNEPEQEFAPPARCQLTLSNQDGALSQDDPGAAFYGLLVTGVLVRIRATHNAVTRTLWIGKIAAVHITPGAVANDGGSLRQATITAEDPMLRLLDTEYTPPLLLNARVDQALTALFESGALAYPYENSYWVLDHHALGTARIFQNTATSFETAQTTLAWSGDNLDRGAGVSAQTVLRTLIDAEAGGRFWWDARAGVFRFHNRHHDALATTVQATLTEQDMTAAAPAYTEDVANVVTVYYEPRSIGAAGTTLWQAGEFTLRPGQARSLTARYTVNEASAAARDLIPPQPGLDIEAQDDDGGGDLTASIAVSVSPAAASSSVTALNTSSRTARITRLQLRGTPLVVGKRDQAAVADAASIAAYDRHERSLQLTAIDNGEFAADVARATLARFKTPRTRFKTVGFIAQRSDTLAQAALDRTVGDRVAISDAWSGHSADYIIVGERHTLDVAGRQQQVTWVLKPAAREPFFVLQTSALDGTAVIAL